MSFDFPNTPSVGDLFQDSSSGAVYRWNGYAWVGGVTGIGLQTIKETRYLVAGSFTFTRDPKSSGFGDIHLLGAMGGRLVSPWVSGQSVAAGGGGAGATTLKWRYPLAASCPVVVGVSSTTVRAQASSFDTVLTADGGAPGNVGTGASSTNVFGSGGGGGVAGSSGDENYPGLSGPAAVVLAGVGYNIPAVWRYLRGVLRIAANPTASNSATIAAVIGDPGAVVVVEYLNP